MRSLRITTCCFLLQIFVKEGTLMKISGKNRHPRHLFLVRSLLYFLSLSYLLLPLCSPESWQKVLGCESRTAGSDAVSPAALQQRWSPCHPCAHGPARRTRAVLPRLCHSYNTQPCLGHNPARSQVSKVIRMGAPQYSQQSGFTVESPTLRL